MPSFPLFLVVLLRLARRYIACAMLVAASLMAKADWQEVRSMAGQRINCLFGDGSFVYAGTLDAGVFRSTNNGFTWNAAALGLPEGFGVSALALHRGYLFAAGFNGALYRSNDRATVWQAAPKAPPGTSIRALLAANGLLWAASNTGVYYSEDAALNWHPLRTGLPGDIQPSSLATGSTALYLGDSKGRVFYLPAGGTTWFPLTAGLFSTNIYCLLRHEGFLYAGTEGQGVFRLQEDTSLWKQFAQGLANTDVIALAPLGNGIAAAAAEAGIFLRGPFDASWRTGNAGIPAGLRVLSMLGTPGSVLAGTSGGLWLRPVSEVISSAENTERSESPPWHADAPHARAVYTADGTLTGLAVDCGAARRCVLEVWSVPGRRLLRRELGAGEHFVTLDAAIPRGLLLLRLYAHGSCATTPVWR